MRLRRSCEKSTSRPSWYGNAVLFENPVNWVNQILTRKWAALATRVNPSWLPVAVGGRTVKRFQEHGCGSYGCVLPTAKPSIVLKLTTDVSEAAFVAYVLRSKEESDGLVRYFKILALADESHRNRPVFAIWREEANDVGTIAKSIPYTETDRIAKSLRYMQKVANLMRDTFKRMKATYEYNLVVSGQPLDPTYFTKQLDQYAEWATQFPHGRDQAMDVARISNYKGIQRIAVARAAYQYHAEEMYSTQHQSLLGDAFMTYLHEDIVLADVHMGNVGMPLDTDRVGSGEPIIVDPGHAFAFDGKLDRPSIETV